MGRRPKTYKNPKTNVEKTKKEWCEELCIKESTFDGRLIRHGTNSPKLFEGKMDAGRTTSVFVRNPATGKKMSVKDISEETGRTQRAIRNRISAGSDVFSRSCLEGAEKFKRVKKHPYPERYVDMTVEEIAEAEGVSHMTISNWARYGKWPERLLPLVEPDKTKVDPGRPGISM